MLKWKFVFVVVTVWCGVLWALSARCEEKAKPKYLGVKKCKGCHSEQFKVWSGLKMAAAFEGLKSDKAKEFSKDAQSDPKCLSCHTVGFGEDSGYKVPDPKNKDDVAKAENLQNVQCESCHGPGEKYVPVMSKAMGGKSLDKKAVQDAGLVIPDESTCQKCHNKNSPVFDEKKWNFEEAKKQIAHPLKK